MVMIPNAAGKTSLYMVPKKDLNQAFLVKPVEGQEWNVDKASFQSAGINISIPNSSSNVPKETSAPILSNTMTVNDLLRNVNVAKEGYDMVNLSKTVTVTSSFSTPNYKPLLLPVCDAPSVKTEPVSDLTQARSVTADTTPTGPATANHSTTFTTSNLIRALLQHKMTQLANSGSQHAYPGTQQANPRPKQANPGPRQANIRPRQPNPGLRQPNPGPQQQQQSAGSQVGPKASNIPTFISKLLQQTATSKDPGGQPAQQQTLLSQTTASAPSGSDCSQTNTGRINPNKNNLDSPVIGGLQTATSASNICLFERKKEQEAVVVAINGLKPASSGVSPTVYMVNGQPYLISVNENDNVAALVTLASTKESLNAAPQSSINASFTTVVSSNTPVMSVKASTSSDSKDNVSSKSVWKPPLSVLNTTNIIGNPRPKLKSSGKSGQLSPINSMGLSVEQLMELKDIMLREHGQLLDRQQLDYINSYTKNLLGKPVSTVKKSATKKQKSTIQPEGRPVFEQEMLESMTRKKNNYMEGSGSATIK